MTYGLISYKRCFVLGPTEKMLMLKFRFCRGITLFCIEFYVTSHIIHLTQYIDKTYSVKQMCTSVLPKFNHKTILWNKAHCANKTICHNGAINVCKYIFPHFFFQIPRQFQR